MTEKRDFTFRDGAFVYLLAIGIDIALQLGLSAVLLVVGLETDIPDWLNLLVSLFLQVGFLLAVVIYCKKTRSRFSYGIKKTNTPFAYPMAAVTAVVCMVCFILAACAFQLLLQVMGYTSQADLEFETLAGKIIGVIATVIAAPICEELVFRGAFLSGLTKKYKEIPAALISGAAFALMHMNPEQTVYQFMLGTALAYLVIKSGSIIPAIIGHSVSNLIAILMELVEPFGAAVDKAVEYVFSAAWFAILITIVLFVAGVFAVYFIGRLLAYLANRKKQKAAVVAPSLDEGAQCAVEGEQAQTEQAKPVIGMSGMAMFLVGIAICAAMWIMVLAAGLMPIMEDMPEVVDAIARLAV